MPACTANETGNGILEAKISHCKTYLLDRLSLGFFAPRSSSTHDETNVRVFVGKWRVRSAGRPRWPTRNGLNLNRDKLEVIRLNENLKSANRSGAAQEENQTCAWSLDFWPRPVMDDVCVAVRIRPSLIHARGHACALGTDSVRYLAQAPPVLNALVWAVGASFSAVPSASDSQLSWARILPAKFCSVRAARRE